MAVERGVWQRVNGVKGGSGSGCVGGLEWRIKNSLEDAKNNLRNIIEFKMWFKKNGTITSYNLTTKESRYEYKIGDNSNQLRYINTRYDWRSVNNNSTIYYITDDFPFKRMSGEDITYEVEVPIIESTGKSEKIVIGTYFNGGDTSSFTYLSCLNIDITSSIPVVELSKKVYIKVDNVFKKGELYFKESNTFKKSNIKVFIKDSIWKEIAS